MKFVDLCCGIGGTSYGALAAGLTPQLLVDRDIECAAALSSSLRKVFLHSDVAAIDDFAVQEICGAEVLFCSPPCQRYSKLRTRNLSSVATNEDMMISESISNIIQLSDFKFVMIENVPEFLKSGEAMVIVDALLWKEFHVVAGTFDATSFGVPQRRKRSLIIATKKSRRLGLDVKQASVRDAFASLPVLNSSDLLHCSRRRHSPLVMERIACIPKDGGSRSALPDRLVLSCHKKTTGYSDIYGRMAWDKPAPTITSGCTNPSKGRFLHPEEDRAITLREAARLQTLPDSVTIEDVKSNVKRAQLIGNAFPSKMVSEILQQVLW